MRNFDAIVIGGGHAGIEAARAAAAMSCDHGGRHCLLTMDASRIGAMSCNPAIGGVAKSHLVSEIDALGGLMGFVADSSGIQTRRLNMNKGPAVRSTRIQCDKNRYVRTMFDEVRSISGLEIVEGEAASLDCVRSEWRVRLTNGTELRARAVIITTGTFMRGLMFCGDKKSSGGRVGDKASNHLSESIAALGHSLTRLKTGTPARLKSSTINFGILEKQWGDPELRNFSWRKTKSKLPQLSCFISHTNERTHEIIRANFHRSALFSGSIVGLGPRYCPSIEDKIRRFADRNRHQIFLEPEGLDTESIYPNGLSTSLDPETQTEFLRSIKGLETVEILRPGYAVEYDTIDPTELSASLMSKACPGLFFAGQVNRTSGYEEAAAQGLWAGIGAALYLQGREPLVPLRSRSYIETLVDDLSSKGSAEPYRMFTSRSEYRLVLREDNARERLFELGKSLSLLCDEQVRYSEALFENVQKGRSLLQEKRVRVSRDRVISLREYLKRPEVTWDMIEDCGDVCDEAVEILEVEAKYEGYLSRQEQELRALREMREWRLDPGFDVRALKSLSQEVQEKVTRLKPKSVFELSRISGIPPSAVLLIARASGRKPSCGDNEGQSVSHETFK